MDTRCDRCGRESEVVNVVEMGAMGSHGQPVRSDYEMVCDHCGHEQTRTVLGS